MGTYRSPDQPDLFPTAKSALVGGYAMSLDEPPPADFIERIRKELVGTLALVREAARLPWSDLTKTTLAELRFNSITNWLPEAEAITLRESFGREMARLWDVAAQEAEDRAE